MRKVIQATLISLDGVVDDVSSWGQKYFDPAWWKSYTQALEACDALLLGRNTYEMLGDRAHSVDNAYTRRLNSIRKYVFSATLKNADWKNFALAALMWLHAARLPARIDHAGNLKGLFEQDRALWDEGLLAEGTRLLEQSATGEVLTEYHVEAGIAGMHATAGNALETRWGEIVELYDVLMRIRPSPVVALNRCMAIAQHQGPVKGLEAVRAIRDPSRLAAYPFYSAVLGELELRRGQTEAAQGHFEEARRLARNDGERGFLDQRIEACARKLRS